MKKLALIPALLLGLLTACTSWQPEGEETLVVEGWIDAGGYPIVMVTTSVPTSTEWQNIDDQRSHMVSFGCKVEVSDGEKTVVLDGTKSSKYFPPYIFTSKTASSIIKGEVGKTYSISVSYEGRTVTGATSIPAPVELDSLWCVPSAEDAGKFNIKAKFTDPAATEDYYRVFVKVVGKDSTYVPGYMGCFSDETLSGTTEINIMRGMSVDNESSWEWNPASFEAGDRVAVKFCTVDRASYDFWDSYSKVVSLSVVPFFPATYNPEYNVQGGIGYWCGYGAREYSITVK